MLIKRGLNTGILQQLVEMRLISGREVMPVNKERKWQNGVWPLPASPYRRHKWSPWWPIKNILGLLMFSHSNGTLPMRWDTTAVTQTQRTQTGENIRGCLQQGQGSWSEWMEGP